MLLLNAKTVFIYNIYNSYKAKGGWGGHWMNGDITIQYTDSYQLYAWMKVLEERSPIFRIILSFLIQIQDSLSFYEGSFRFLY